MSSGRGGLFIGDLVSGGAIIFSWFGYFSGIVTPIIAGVASVIAIIFYSIQIMESPAVHRVRLAHRLSRLVRIRAQATALELSIREADNDIKHSLDRANLIHAAAVRATIDTQLENSGEKNEKDTASSPLHSDVGGPR